ncbi:MAG: protein kinase [Candidatus Obscuribacterales bacterium]|nr:protein kinase [Candidatus Obscuribacterales bacterium]
MKLCPECYSEFEDNLTQCPEDKIALATLDSDPLVGTRLADRYTILSIIGRGGMGVVYKARHEMMDRTVAIKMLHAHLVTDTEAMKRFHREAKVVSRVQHPHSITLYDFGVSSSGQPYIVMDFVQGISLKTLIKEQGALPLERVRYIFTQVADTLKCAHAQGVIHRDLKPENIMLTTHGDNKDWVQVVDFGISKLVSTSGDKDQKISRITRIGDVCGSPPYMSPEQCISALNIDSRTDIYSLAVVVYEALTGRLPFLAKSAIEMIDCHLYGQPTSLKIANPELSLCDSLNNLFNKALQKEPQRRHQTVEEFGYELSEAIKQDALRMRSLRQRVEVSQFKKLVDEAEGNVDTEPKMNRAEGRSGYLSNIPVKVIGDTGNQKVGILDRLKALVLGAPEQEEDAGFVLSECPYCGKPTDPQVNFCLDCGRHLATPQEVASLRSAQQVFVYPKYQKKKEQKSPHFSRKAKVASANTSSISIGSFLVVIVLFLCLMHFASGGKAFKGIVNQVNEFIEHSTTTK